MNRLQLILNAYRNESVTDRQAWFMVLDLHIAGRITLAQLRLVKPLINPDCV